MTTLCQVVWSLVNDKLEMICKLVALAKSGYYPGTYLKRQRKEIAALTIVDVLAKIRKGYLQ